MSPVPTCGQKTEPSGLWANSQRARCWEPRKKLPRPTSSRSCLSTSIYLLNTGDVLAQKQRPCWARTGGVLWEHLAPSLAPALERGLSASNTTTLPRLLGMLPSQNFLYHLVEKATQFQRQLLSGSAFEVLGEAHPEITLVKELQSHKTHFSCSFSS